MGLIVSEATAYITTSAKAQIRKSLLISENKQFETHKMDETRSFKSDVIKRPWLAPMKRISWQEPTQRLH